MLFILSYYKDFAISPIIRIPKKLRKNDSGMNNDVLIFDKPIIARPNSSGRGEATIKAPKSGISHLKIFNLKMESNLSVLEIFIKYRKS